MAITLETAQRYLHAKLSVLPAHRINKFPAIKSWKAYQQRLPTEAEVIAQFSNNHEAVCIIAGKVSGNLEIIDFDNGGELFERWSRIVEERVSGLMDRIVIENTPSGGWHVIYRCEIDVSGNMKLAQGQRDGKLTTLIETRGNGGLFLCAPTPGYELLQGDFTALPTLTEAERETLLQSAWELNEHWQTVNPPSPAATTTGTRPGDAYNERGNIKSLLEAHGWKHIHTANGNEYFRRPGKTTGSWSASLKDRVFYVFSSNAAPFEPNQAYSPFSVYALLEHQGDFADAAKTLSQHGYGEVLPALPEVDISGILPEAVEPVKPWRKISDDDIMGIIAGTCIGDMTEVFSRVTKPPLPLEAALLKAIVLAGCALSEKAENPSGGLAAHINEGAALGRLRINTAGGQVGNIYAMLAAPSTSGKDIGNLLDLTTKQYGWRIASAGSAEGIADALVKKNNGLIFIAEMQNWLDSRHWQHKATPFLTETFNKGSFEHVFSVRGKGVCSRSSNYCFPSIIAHIQPEVFESIVSKQDVSSGFLGRFLYCKMSDFDGRPAKLNLDQSVQNLGSRVDAFRQKCGVVRVPDDYLGELFNMFRRESHEKLHSVWKRLVNEYGPKLAVMLSVTPRNAGQQVIITDACWNNTAKLLQWFFFHAEKMLFGIEDGNEFIKLRERLFKRIFKAVKRSGDIGTRWVDISRYAGYGSTAKEREEALRELADRGIIELHNARYFIKNAPPEWD